MLGFHLGVDEVLEVGQAVARGHGKQPVRVFRLPGEIRRHVVGRDGKGEDPALGVAGGHHLDVGAVDHVHLSLQFAVGEWRLDATDDGHLLAQILRAGPVEGQIGERCLRTPARRHVEVVISSCMHCFTCS